MHYVRASAAPHAARIAPSALFAAEVGAEATDVVTRVEQRRRKKKGPRRAPDGARPR